MRTSAIHLFLLFISITAMTTSAHADSSRLASAPLLAAARAKGFTFTIIDFKVMYDPKWTSEAKTSVAFAVRDIRQNGKPIVVADDQSSPERLRTLDAQFTATCKNLFDLSTVDVPDARVASRAYEYNAAKEIVSLECVMIFPAR